MRATPAKGMLLRRGTRAAQSVRSYSWNVGGASRSEPVAGLDRNRWRNSSEYAMAANIFTMPLQPQARSLPRGQCPASLPETAACRKDLRRSPLSPVEPLCSPHFARCRGEDVGARLRSKRWSRTLEKLTKPTPSASVQRFSSTMSSRRTPRSHLLTKVWCSPMRSASSIWLMLTLSRAARSSSRKWWYSGACRGLDIGGLLVLLPASMRYSTMRKSLL
jgi:hypothetical protein